MLLTFLLCGLAVVKGDLDFLCTAINKTCPPNTLCRSVHDWTKGLPVTSCIKMGFCPEPEPWEAQFFGARQCRRECDEDPDCPGEQRCCRDFYSCGKKCRDPVPEKTCDNTRCKGEEACVKGSCVNLTCTPPCKKDFRCEMDVDPSCSKARCPQVHRCLPKQPSCAPPCTNGYSCMMAEASPCMTPPCPKVPQCKILCDPFAAGINYVNCVHVDMCNLQSAPRPGEISCRDGSSLVQGFDIPECIARRCPSGTFCRLVIDSTTGLRSPKCLKGGYCPDPPLWEGLLFGGKQCDRQCEEDTDCTGAQICCNDFFGCGKKCRDPLPEYTCEHLKCKENEMCIMKETQCSRQACFPTPTCVNSTCNPPCGTGLKCEVDVDPSCTKTPCPLIPRCLAKEPSCSPPCAEGYSCLLTQAAGCLAPPCPKAPRCRPQCLAYPGGINESNCIVTDICSSGSAPGLAQCPNATVCCQTVCGRRCLTPRPL